MPKFAIPTRFGLFEFSRIPFGLRNSAQSSERSTNEVLRGLSFIFAYIDDVLITSRNMNGHMKHMQLGLERLKHFGL